MNKKNATILDLKDKELKLNRNILYLLFILLFISGCARFYAKAGLFRDDLIPLVKKVQPAVLTIVTYDIDHNVSDLGSGFFVDQRGHLVTNYHEENRFQKCLFFLHPKGAVKRKLQNIKRSC